MSWQLIFGPRLAGSALLLLSTALGIEARLPAGTAGDVATTAVATAAPAPPAAPSATAASEAVPQPAASTRPPQPTPADFSAAFERATARALPSVVSIEVAPRPSTSRRSSPDKFTDPRSPDKGEPRSKDGPRSKDDSGSLEDWFRERRRENSPGSKMPFGEKQRQEYGGSDSPFGSDKDDDSDDDEEPSGRSIGSGVIIDASGLVLTNHHVVDSEGTITVRTSDGREFRVAQVWSDERTDLAVLKLENPSNLTAAVLADSDEVQVGQWVLALGQPFGLESTVTAGIVSARQRRIGLAERESHLQTDAAINPGNSGGPLVNLNGEVIGINTAISSRSGGNEGIGFAIPINLAKWVVDQLTHGGEVRRSFLGVTVQAVTAELAEELGVGPREGVIVTEVAEGSPADDAGVEVGDVILAVGGDKVDAPAQLQLLVERSPSGREQQLSVLRKARRMTLKFMPEEQGERSTKAESRGKSRGPATDDDRDGFDRLGLMVSDRGNPKSGASSNGVTIADVESGSAADRAGLESGMVIMQVDHQDVDSAEEYADAVADVEGKVLLLVRTEDGARFVVLTPE